jgi:hypothetical protein
VGDGGSLREKPDPAMTQKSSTGGYDVAIAGSSGYQNHVEKGEPSTTSMVVESVLRVCKEVDVNCSVEQ